MANKPSSSFRDFYTDDNNISPAERAKIELEVEMIGKFLKKRESQESAQIPSSLAAPPP